MNHGCSYVTDIAIYTGFCDVASISVKLCNEADSCIRNIHFIYHQGIAVGIVQGEKARYENEHATSCFITKLSNKPMNHNLWENEE